MKKLVLIICIFLLCSCTKFESKDYKNYKNYINELKTSQSTNNNLPFDIEIILDKVIETEVTYRVIIDNPKVALRNIEALVIHDKYTKDIFPSVGIFDDRLNLIPNVINKSSNYVEGIILVGYIPFEEDIKNLNANFKLLFKYEDDNNNIKTIIYSTNK